MGSKTARTQVIIFASIPQTHLFCEFHIGSGSLSEEYAANSTDKKGDHFSHMTRSIINLHLCKFILILLPPFCKLFRDL